MFKILTEISDNAIEMISNMNAEQIALFSIFITFLIYTLGKRNEMRMKRHEAKKAEYRKFISFFESVYINVNSKKQVKMTSEKKKEFFDVGSGLLIYGSRKLYKKYIFYREFSTNPIIKKSKFNAENLTVYLLGDMLKQIRKEIGLNSFNGISSNDALSFFINDLATNSLAKKNMYKAQYQIIMIKLELFLVEVWNLTFFNKIAYKIVYPLLSALLLIIKYLVIIPIGKIVIKLFPKLEVKNTTEKS